MYIIASKPKKRTLTNCHLKKEKENQQKINIFTMWLWSNDTSIFFLIIDHSAVLIVQTYFKNFQVVSRYFLRKICKCVVKSCIQTGFLNVPGR